MPLNTSTTEHVHVTPAQRLGESLRTRRKAQGINMTAAAEAAGISRVTWHRLEKGESSVAWGSMLTAAAVLGLDVRFAGSGDDNVAAEPSIEGFLPLRIGLADFPGLRRLAWQVGEGVEILTPREAFGLYARNARHLDFDALSVRERSLLHTLREVFGEMPAGV